MCEARDVIIYLAIKYEGEYQRVLKAIYEKEDPNPFEVEELVSSLKSNVITMCDEDYPEYLKREAFPPIVLFYYGDISLINDENFNRNLAVIGTRKPTQYGIDSTISLVNQLSRKFNIVSGMAKGIDGIAQETTVNNRGKTIAVLGSGIDNIYPYENARLYHRIIRSGGLIISEYPNMVEPHQWHFPIRDRLIAMLAKGVLVTEAYGRTGTSITVGFALEYSRAVFAIPHPIGTDDNFCNQLLYEGATIVRNGKDVIDYLEKSLDEKTYRGS